MFDICPPASDLAAAKMSDERPSFVAHLLCLTPPTQAGRGRSKQLQSRPVASTTNKTGSSRAHMNVSGTCRAWAFYPRFRRSLESLTETHLRGLTLGLRLLNVRQIRLNKSNRVSGKRPAREATLGNSNENVAVPDTPARLAGESWGGTTITLAMQTPERLGFGPDIAPEPHR